MVIEYRKEGQIAIFTISRPEGTNSLNSPGMQELSEAMMDFCDDPELRTGIITGKGKRVFCAGADLREMMPLMQAEGRPKETPPMPQRGLRINKPLIAAINGLAVGGGLEIALACDIRIADENARFGLPEVTIGLIPGWGGTQRLPRLVPSCKAAEMILTGKLINARSLPYFSGKRSRTPGNVNVHSHGLCRSYLPVFFLSRPGCQGSHAARYGDASG